MLAATIVVVAVTKISGIVVAHAMVKAMADGIVTVLVLVLTTVAAVIMSVTAVPAKAILEVNCRLPLP